ncbi:hypothetical protein O2V63_11990 [Modestobacter sp. VKM Ac-2977]|uniref:hypothetical protein n=1 Tax=Modestobacter sp. VKM Ac-2977 TaxID=3004131 RepID=UPI0022AA1CB4|nr:hypothetical protein [Modestobacter sp. VKM Ac-2977]MCZ2821053.1 hypothetical protein [Modestobacter sp. VKM Ac-2977]
MGSLSTGGGSSAVAASAHAGCERFRRTDPLITKVSRKKLASDLGAPDVSAGIPEARWMRAMTFERLVHSDRFVSELLTKAVGQLGLPRPGGVRRRSGKVLVDITAAELAAAHARAAEGHATMLTELAVPFVGLEGQAGATPTKPDFAIVCPRVVDGDGAGSWLIMGDAKDYERVRSRIDDARLLKGFLQVALGAESAKAWSKLPAGMVVHEWGALAVPRNAFLQPEAVVERLDDHRAEVRARARERTDALAAHDTYATDTNDPTGYVQHLEAEYDPSSCPTCNLFTYCRDELRQAATPDALLIELGVERLTRPAVRGLVDGTGVVAMASPQVLANIRATASGLPEWTTRRRVDPVGLPGAINVVLAKSDAAALGVHGIAVQQVGASGPGAWRRLTFLEPQALQTRTAVMGVIGAALREVRHAGAGPVHLVVPDKPTADLLVSMADSLAGVELSRLRWQHDLDTGRSPLTFDGELAEVPAALGDDERLAVSFLLEADRARAMSLRSAIVDLRGVLATHVVAGGPSSDSGRLDYLVRWAGASQPVQHRDISDEIAQQLHTPGARLSNEASDEIHAAHRRRTTDEAAYRQLVHAAIDYRISVHEQATAVLDALPISKLRAVHRVLEMDAQEVWGRRVALHASDLVRFSRTFPAWRNAQVDMLDADNRCASQLTMLADTDCALERAQDAGVRELAEATVLTTTPLRLRVRSRRLVEGSSVVVLHVNDAPVVEEANTTVQTQKGSFKFGQLPIGPLTREADAEGLRWSPGVSVQLQVGDRLILADASWFKTFRSGHEIAIDRPKLDERAAPKSTCTPSSFASDPPQHRWCCRPHEDAEAEWSDTLAARRARGELNPQTWPPLIDEDRFDVGINGPQLVTADDGTAVPADLTLDDIE